MPLLLMLARGSGGRSESGLCWLSSGGVVYTADGEAVAVGEMMRRFPVWE